MKTLLNKLNRIIIYISDIIDIGFKNREVMKNGDCYITIKKFLKFHKPTTLYDIGANSGIWSDTMYKLNPQLKNVVLFEPQKKYCDILRKNNFLPNIKKTVYNTALGNEDKISEIKGGTASASMLDTNEQNIFFPDSLDNTQEFTTVKRLDDIFYSDKLTSPDTIKIDVQGYELLVLLGSQKILKETQFLIIELSFRELYLGQPKLSEILGFLEKNNFFLIDFGYEWRNEKTKELIQIDAFFSKKKDEK